MSLEYVVTQRPSNIKRSIYLSYCLSNMRIVLKELRGFWKLEQWETFKLTQKSIRFFTAKTFAVVHLQTRMPWEKSKKVPPQGCAVKPRFLIPSWKLFWLAGLYTVKMIFKIYISYNFRDHIETCVMYFWTCFSKCLAWQQSCISTIWFCGKKMLIILKRLSSWKNYFEEKHSKGHWHQERIGT